MVCYSLTLPPADRRDDLVWQLDASLESLRAVAPSLPIRVFFHGQPPRDVVRIATQAQAELVIGPTYRERLAALLPAAAPVLDAYPLLHKFLNFGALADRTPTQVLLADCDTIFFHDPARLFEGYTHADCVAREEPTTARSAVGHDPTYVDEPALAALAAVLGAAPTPAFNIGVLLLNNARWRDLAALERQFLIYAFRFLTWMALHPADGAAAQYGESAAAIRLREQYRALLTPRICAAALPYPSANRWILDQVALWCTLGHIPGLRYADFARSDVCQNGELFQHDAAHPPWVVAHYFSQNMAAVDRWLRTRA
jgi:hypothetical protein